MLQGVVGGLTVTRGGGRDRNLCRERFATKMNYKGNNCSDRSKVVKLPGNYDRQTIRPTDRQLDQ